MDAKSCKLVAESHATNSASDTTNSTRVHVVTFGTVKCEGRDKRDRDLLVPLLAHEPIYGGSACLLPWARYTGFWWVGSPSPTGSD